MNEELDRTELYEECVAMLAGTTRKLPTLEHLFVLREAMQEAHEVTLIRISNEMDVMKRRVLEMP